MQRIAVLDIRLLNMDRHANNLLVSRVSFSGGGAFVCCYSHSRGAFECCSDSRGAFECCYSHSRGNSNCYSHSRGAFECCSDSRDDSNCCSDSRGDSIHSTTHNHPIHATNNNNSLSHPRTWSVDGNNSLSHPRDNYTGYVRASNPAYRSQSTTSEMVTPALRLVPIDHGYALPRTSTTQVPEWCWMQWYHSKQPVTAVVRAHVEALDAESDVELLRWYVPGIEEAALNTLRVNTLWLKLVGGGVWRDE